LMCVNVRFVRHLNESSLSREEKRPPSPQNKPTFLGETEP